MAVTLTTNAKDWIAQNLGIGNCMTETAQSFTYRDSVNNIDIPDSGITATILNRLIDSLVPYVTIGGTQYTYAALKTQNNNVDLVYPDDVQWVMANDAGAAQYCAGVAPTPSEGDLKCIGDDVYRYTSGVWSYVETCTIGCSGGACLATAPSGQTETGPLEVTIVEGNPYPGGDDIPSVVLDTSKAFAYFKATPMLYVGVMDIWVTNLSSQYWAYFTWEMRMWRGSPPTPTTCPTTTPAHTNISRFLGKVSDQKVISTKLLGASESAMIGGSFEIPQDYRGAFTLCLSLWGNYSKDSLIAELGAEGYPEEIPW